MSNNPKTKKTDKEIIVERVSTKEGYLYYIKEKVDNGPYPTRVLDITSSLEAALEIVKEEFN